MNYSNLYLFQIVLGLCFASALQAEEGRDHNITLDDYFTLAYLLESIISPDGQYVAYAEARWQESTDDRKADVWVVTTTNGEIRRLTFDRGGDNNLKWSPDSKYLYFAGNRHREGATQPPYDDTKQVWRVPVEGGEPLAITRFPGGIGVFDLSNDGHAIYYTTTHQDSGGEWSTLRDQFKNIQYAVSPGQITEVNKLDLQNWRIETFATLKRAISELSFSPERHRLALITAPEDTVMSFEGHSQIEVIQLATAESKVLPDELWRAKAPSPYGRLEALTWSKDGRALSFIIAFDGISERNYDREI